MKTIVLHTPKGGSGKSTTARELAVAASMSNALQVALADLDPQGTTAGWYERRDKQEPRLVQIKPTGSWDTLIKAGVDLLVIDTPPGQPTFIPALLQRADLVIVPCRPTPDDLLAAAPIARSLASHPAWCFVLTQVPSRTRLLPSAIRQLAALGRVAPAQLGFRADFPGAAIDGSAAAELEGTAGTEATDLWNYVRSIGGL